MQALDDLQQDAAEALRQYMAEGNTSDIREAAECMVAAREYILDGRGDPDWRGRTHAYRVWSAGVVTAAGVPHDQRSRVQAAIRYHASAALRKRIPAEDVEALGMLTETALERSRGRRGRTSGLIQIVNGSGPITDPEDILTALELIEGMVRRVRPGLLALSDSE
jgi:hypothetical protein